MLLGFFVARENLVDERNIISATSWLSCRIKERKLTSLTGVPCSSSGVAGVPSHLFSPMILPIAAASSLTWGNWSLDCRSPSFAPEVDEFILRSTRAEDGRRAVTPKPKDEAFCRPARQEETPLREEDAPL